MWWGTLEFLKCSLLWIRKKWSMLNPWEGEQQVQMPWWQTHMLIQFASPEVGKELLHLGYLTVTSWLSFMDVGLQALREGADIAALRHYVWHAQERVLACLFSLSPAAYRAGRVWLGFAAEQRHHGMTLSDTLCFCYSTPNFWSSYMLCLVTSARLDIILDRWLHFLNSHCTNS